METYPGTAVIRKNSSRPFSETIKAYNTNDEIVCCFRTVIIAVAALDRKYPGGHQAFLERHQGWCNRHIMAVFQRGAALRKVLQDLKKYGLTNLSDWIHLEEDKIKWSWDMFNFETEAPWLKGRYKKGNLYVRYTRNAGRDN
jgi:hypothetical protein